MEAAAVGCQMNGVWGGGDDEICQWRARERYGGSWWRTSLAENILKGRRGEWFGKEVTTVSMLKEINGQDRCLNGPFTRLSTLWKKDFLYFVSYRDEWMTQVMRIPMPRGCRSQAFRAGGGEKCTRLPGCCVWSHGREQHFWQWKRGCL